MPSTIDNSSVCDEEEDAGRKSSFGYRPRRQSMAGAVDAKVKTATEKNDKLRPRSRFGLQPSSNRISTAVSGVESGFCSMETPRCPGVAIGGDSLTETCVVAQTPEHGGRCGR